MLISDTTEIGPFRWFKFAKTNLLRRIKFEILLNVLIELRSQIFTYKKIWHLFLVILQGNFDCFQYSLNSKCIKSNNLSWPDTLCENV